MLRFNHQGIIHLPILIAICAVIGFLIMTSFAPVKDQLFSSIYKKDNSFASEAFPSDINSDGIVSIIDMSILLSKWNTGDSLADVNKDGKVGIVDFSVLLSNWGKSAPAQANMIEGVSVCTDHDITKWHDLVKKDGAGNIICTYGHEHHDDPNLVNDIFGPPGAWFDSASTYSGQSISYPWQTFAFTTDPAVNYQFPPVPSDPSKMENALKHNGYKWFVKRDLPCIPFWPAPNDGCFKAYRVQVHHLGTVHDANTRFHSFSMEALVDYHGQIGIIRGGGWTDTGYMGLAVDGGGVNAVLCPSIPTNPPSFNCLTSGTHRGFGSTNVPSPHTPHANPGSLTNWYGAHKGGVQVGVMVEDFGPIDYFNPTQQVFYPEQYKANNSRSFVENMAAGVMGFDFIPELRQYMDSNKIVNFRGYQNRHGDFVFTGCSQIGVDCVPFVSENASAKGAYIMNRNTNNAVFDGGDHDVASPVTGKSLIVYPN